MKLRPDRGARSLPGRLLSAACLVAVVVGTPGCIVYNSPRCLFDKGAGIAVASLRFQPDHGTRLGVSYWRDGFVDTLADGDALFCRRLEPEAHRRIMEALEDPRVTVVDTGAPFKEALSYGPSRFLVYAQFDARARPPVLWWAPDLPTEPGHIERLDELFCAFERELSYLRRTVKKYGAEFLEARGRERPCGVS